MKLTLGCHERVQGMPPTIGFACIPGEAYDYLYFLYFMYRVP